VKFRPTIFSAIQYYLMHTLKYDAYPFRMNCIGFNGATQILLLSYSVKGATTLLIIHNERRLSHLPGTTTIIPYGVTLIFRRSVFHTALGSAYLYY